MQLKETFFKPNHVFNKKKKCIRLLLLALNINIFPFTKNTVNFVFPFFTLMIKFPI